MMETDSVYAHEHILLFMFFMSAIALYVAWRYRFFDFTPQRLAPVLSWTHVAGAFAVFLGTSLLLMPVILSVWLFATGESLSAILDPVPQGWFNVVGILINAGGVMLYLFSLHPVQQQAVLGVNGKKGRAQALHDFGVGAVAWFVSYPLMLFFGQLAALYVLYHFNPTHYDQIAVKYLKSTMEYPWLFAVTTLLLVGIVPVVEETLFRGFLQTWLKQHMSVYVAIVITALLFAAFHFSMSQGYDNIELIVSLFVFACFLGYVYERQRSLWASVGLHCTFNAVSVLMISQS